MTKKTITSKSLGREIEIGEWLTPDEVSAVKHDLIVTLTQLPLKRLLAAKVEASKRGADGANAGRKEAAEARKAEAVKRFKYLMGGLRDVDEAIARMIAEDWKRASLYRYLKDELERRGRTRVKRNLQLKTNNSQ